MPRIIFEAVLDSSGAVTGLKKLEAGLETLGSSSGKTATEMRASERELQRLLDRLEPARVATEKFERQKKLLTAAFNEGRISGERYTKAIAGLEAQQASAASGTSKLVGIFNNLQAVMATVAAAAGVRQFIGWMSETVKMAGEAEQAEVRLAAVLKSTGGAAGISAGQIAQYASKMQALTGVSDEVITNAAAVMATFRHISSEVFPQAMTAALDLSAVLGQDLQSSVLQIAKALEDPIRGITALRRAGIQFSEDQEKMIESLVRSGKQLEAQRLILKELETQFGGTAEALGETFTGRLNALTESWGDLREEIGKFITSSGSARASIEDLTTIIVAMTQSISTAREEGKKAPEWVDSFTRSISEAIPQVGGFYKQLHDIQTILAVIATYSAQPAAVESAVPWATNWKEESEGLIDVIGYLDKYGKEQEESSKAIEKHNKAARDFNLTAAAQAKAVDTLTEKLRNQVLQREALSDLEKRFSSDVKKTLKDMSRLLTEYANAQVDANVELRTWLALLEQQGMVRPREGFFPNAADYFGGIKESANQFGDLFAESFADAFIGFMQGDDFGDLWTGLWESLAGGAAAKFGKAFDALFSGADWKTAMKESGLYDPEGKGVQGRWGGAIGAGGAMLGAYNMRQKQPSPWIGALSGAATGFAAGGWIGALVGAIAGYFMTPSTSQHGYEYGFRGREGYVGEVSGGVTPQVEAELERAMTSAYRTTALAFHDILKQLGVAPGALKEVTIATRRGEATDPVQVLKQFIQGELPREVFNVYKDTLSSALTQFKVGDQFAVSTQKAQELMANFTNLPFDQAMVALQRYVSVLVALDQLYDDLGKSLDQLEAEINMTMRQTFLNAMNETIAGIEDLTEGLDQLTTEEQVARADEIMALTRQQYEMNLRYLEQIISIQKGVNQSFDEMFASWEETRAGEKGSQNLGEWYEQQIEKWQLALKEATSPEQAQYAMSQLQKFYQKLWELGGEVWPSAGGDWRQWVEEQAKSSQEIFNTMMEAWKTEVETANQRLIDALDKLTTAITGSTGERPNVPRRHLITGEILPEEPPTRPPIDIFNESVSLSTVATNAEVAAREQSTQAVLNSVTAMQSAADAAYYLAEAAGEAGVLLASLQALGGGGLPAVNTVRRSA